MKSCSGLLHTIEVSASYSLLFGQSVGGRDEARRLFGVPVRGSYYPDGLFSDLSTPLASLEVIHWRGKILHLLLEIRLTLYEEAKRLGFAQFDILGPRLANIKNRMEDWSPKSVRDLTKPGYGDRFTYYTQLFALFIAAIGVVGVILSIVQTAYAIISTRYAAMANNDDSVQLALEKIEGTLLLLLNATEE